VAVVCALPPRAAADLLERAEGQVKPAVVMHRLGLSLTAARKRLADHRGHLRRALGE
jgi:N-acetylmuramic acid 6-phosphate (MurNAc-6-P) etherase